MVTLYHRRNELALDASSLTGLSAIEINYSGKMQGESQLDDNWMMRIGKNKILIMTLSCSCDSCSCSPEILLNYNGKIDIKSAVAVTRDLVKHPVSISVEDIDYWENITSSFDTNSQYWDGLNSDHQSNESISYSNIVTNNLQTNNNEFYFKDGMPYNGAYHQHGDGQAMTGAKHTADSEFIYKKDLNQNIIDIRKNINKREVLEVMSQAPAFIPTIRRYTKSNLDKVKDSASINTADVRGMIKDITADFIYNQNRTLAQINVMGVDKSNELKATLEEASTTWKPIKGGPVKDRPKGYDKSLGEFVDIDISEFSAEVKKKEKDY